MLFVLGNTLITFSVIYTLIGFIKWIYKLFTERDNWAETCYIVIRVCNQEGTIEGIVRGLILKYLKISSGEFIPNIIIIDTGSHDNTPKICKKLSDDYSFVYFIDGCTDVSL